MTTVELGRYMSSLRNIKGYTKPELAEKSNIPVRTIERLEHGENVTIDVFLSLLKVLGFKLVIESEDGE